MSHHALNHFPISTFPYLNTIWKKIAVTQAHFRHSSFCSIHNKEGSFCKSTKNWKLDHKNMVKVLGFLLGFYTATVMKRWWSQISHMPLITNVSMVLNGK